MEWRWNDPARPQFAGLGAQVRALEKGEHTVLVRLEALAPAVQAAELTSDVDQELTKYD